MDPHKEYLTTKVNPVLEPLLVDIYSKKPNDPLQFIIDWLEKRISHGKEERKKVDLPPQPKAKTQKGAASEDENITDEDDDIVSEAVIAKKRVSVIRRAISSEVHSDIGKGKKFVPRVISKTEEQNGRIRAKLKSSFIFNALDSQEIDAVIGAMEEKTVKAGEIVIKQREDGDNLYVVDSGTLTCVKQFAENEEPKFLKEYVPGEAFGELALLYNAPRAATITAKTDCVLWSLDRSTFTHIVKNAAINKRNQHEEFLKGVEIFSTVEPYELTKIMDAVKPVEYKAGSAIINEGDEGNSFFLLEKGEAYAMKRIDPSKPPVQVMEYKEGSYFGELALIRNTPRAASVIAKTNCLCLTLDRHSFKRLLGPLDEILKRNTEVYKRFVPST